MNYQQCIDLFIKVKCLTDDICAQNAVLSQLTSHHTTFPVHSMYHMHWSVKIMPHICSNIGFSKEAILLFLSDS